MYPLTVATKSQDESRKDAAENILQNMREHSSALVQQAIMVSEELIRVAILWHEQWHEGLEDASRYEFATLVSIYCLFVCLLKALFWRKQYPWDVLGAATSAC